MYQNTLRTYQHFFLHWTGLRPFLLFLKHGCIGLILIYSIVQATILFLVNNAGCFYCPFSKKNSKCEGVDGLSMSPIKETIDLRAAPFSHICNLSFEHGVFPGKLKFAKILSVFKCDPSLFSNCRPISSLPCLSKVFEKLFYLRLSRFLQSLISLIIISMVLDHITLLLRLS